MSSDNVADQAGGEWKWALSKTKGKVYMYNTADQNKVLWLHDLKDAYQAYVTCKDAIDETVGEEPAVSAEERLGLIPESEPDETLGEEAAVSAEGDPKRPKWLRPWQGGSSVCRPISESEPKRPRLCLRYANAGCRYGDNCKYEHRLERCRHWLKHDGECRYGNKCKYMHGSI